MKIKCERERVTFDIEKKKTLIYFLFLTKASNINKIMLLKLRNEMQMLMEKFVMNFSSFRKSLSISYLKV